MSKILEAKSIQKVFSEGSGNDLVVLNEVDIAFEAGCHTSIVGTSGSGKSTLLNLLGGLDHPTKGEILFQGENINHYPSNQLSNWRNRHIGFIFQFHHLLPDFTALENVQMPALIAGTAPALARKNATNLLEQVGLKERLTHKPAKLSGGEQQRVAIARALTNQPTIILADEPTGNLDEETAEKVGQLLIDVSQEYNTTIVLVTHNPGFAKKMERNFRLSNGNISPQQPSL